MLLSWVLNLSVTRMTAKPLEPAKSTKTAGRVRRKKCVTCAQLKPLEEFGKHDSSEDGRTSHCKECRAGQNKRYRRRNLMHRLKHHIATRVAMQVTSPPGLVENLESYLGYTMVQLKTHLENDIREREGISLREAFERGYHLDHIRPLSSFQVTHIRSKAFRECWAIDNLRMIPAEENLKKGAKILPEGRPVFLCQPMSRSS